MQKGLLAKLLLLVATGAGAGAAAQIMLPPGAVPAVVFSPSGWSLLTNDEQRILLPLAEQWDAMGSAQQEKWRGIARKYRSLSPREQQKIQRRMTRWAGVAPEQRVLAREKYQTYRLKKPEAQARVRTAWRNRLAAKMQGSLVSLPSAHESPVNEAGAGAELVARSSVPPEGSGPRSESPKVESEK